MHKSGPSHFFLTIKDFIFKNIRTQYTFSFSLLVLGIFYMYFAGRYKVHPNIMIIITIKSKYILQNFISIHTTSIYFTEGRY